ncbi:MAG TPA: hypothetical protein DHW02_13985 [Ktedonobacter sp.]|nr:hypothetical protein [Ktedonobacter sp.]
MNTDSESTNTGNTQSTGGESPGAGLTNTMGESLEQRVGNAGHITPQSPEVNAENVKTTEAAFSSGTKPADKGQTDSSGETNTTNTMGNNQTNTTGQ